MAGWRRRLASMLALAAVSAVPAAVVGSYRRSVPPPAIGHSLDGVTLDRITGLSGVLAGLRVLPRRPTVRVYLRVHEPAAHYGAPSPESPTTLH